MKKYKIFKIYAICLISLFAIALLVIFVIPQNGTKVTTTTSSVETGTVTTTDTSYEDDNIKITITEERVDETNVYIADVQIKNIEYLKTAFADNTYGLNYKETTSDIASSVNAILAINGDYYGFRSKGFVVRNGTLYRTTSNGNQSLLIKTDGSFAIVDEDTTSLSSLDDIWQAFSFGPALITDSTISVTTSEEVAQSMTSNPRTAIGIIDNLHYVFVVSDGRTSSNAGLTLYQLATVMKDLGCITAYNLDGGGSTTMYFNGNVVNNPTSGTTSGERKVSDIIYVGY
jgi:exopolysaccharide biosynthesis protein